MFDAHSKVTQVAYEQDQAKAFDDVVVFYNGEMIDIDGQPLNSDFYQIKFHQTAAGALTWQNLMDPAFINASTVSILQRLRDVQRRLAPDGFGCRFYLYTTWKPHPDDSLAVVVSETDGGIDWHRLAGGGSGSKKGQIRASLRQHLELASDDELRKVLQPFRLWQGPTLEQLGQSLNIQLREAGFLPVPDGTLNHPYDELTRKLLQSGQTTLTRATAEQHAHREGLWRGRQVREPEACRIGIRSFLRHAEYMEDETDHHLCLLRYFEGRHIKDAESWQSAIYPDIVMFLSQQLRGGQHYHLYLHTHTSVTFAAGYYLDSKSGMDIVPVQSTRAGRELWRPQISVSSEAYTAWSFREIFSRETDEDLALAISVTHAAKDDVCIYIKQALPQVGRVIECTLPAGASNTSVVDGTHAKLLADQIARYLKTERTHNERHSRLHLFIAAPNGLTFFLGQLARGFGQIALYEYNLEQNRPGDYCPSLHFPPR